MLEYIMEPKEADRNLDRWSIEIAPFESKTKEIWEWKKTIKPDDKIDVQDDAFKWGKATILSITDEVIEGTDRTYPLAVVGMRIYKANGPISDGKGAFEGWSSTFDEKVPIYSPRIVKF